MRLNLLTLLLGGRDVSYYADLGTECDIARGPQIRAVGWLSDRNQYETGSLPSQLVERLRSYVSRCPESIEELCWPVAAGPHTCELCGSFGASLNFGLPSERVLFVCPEMILHYVEVHEYRPPEPFLRALEKAPLPGTPEYASAVAPFRAEQG